MIFPLLSERPVICSYGNYAAELENIYPRRIKIYLRYLRMRKKMHQRKYIVSDFHILFRKYIYMPTLKSYNQVRSYLIGGVLISTLLFIASCGSSTGSSQNDAASKEADALSRNRGVPSIGIFDVSRNRLPEPGQSMQLFATVECSEVNCNYNSVQFYRSSDSRITARDTLLGNQPTPPLSSGEGRVQFMETDAPNTGRHYYGACIENSCSISVLVNIQGSFIIERIGVSKNDPEIGEDIRLSTSMFCISGPCGERTLSFYRSQDSVIDTTDTLLMTRSVSPTVIGQRRSKEVRINTGDRAVTYYYGACIRSDCTEAIRVTIDDEDGDSYGNDEDLDDDGNGLTEIRTAEDLDDIRRLLNNFGNEEDAPNIMQRPRLP